MRGSDAAVARGEASIWQRRFWEHRIRDDGDMQQHMDYVHFNPVKHGYAERAAAWPYSTFGRYVRRGMYGLDWAAGAKIEGLAVE